MSERATHTAVMDARCGGGVGACVGVRCGAVFLSCMHRKPLPSPHPAPLPAPKLRSTSQSMVNAIARVGAEAHHFIWAGTAAILEAPSAHGGAAAAQVPKQGSGGGGGGTSKSAQP